MTLRQRDGDQPLPVPNDYPDVQSMVIADIEARRELGVQRYGTALQPFNQRDGLIDAYEECTDLVCYLRQLVAERGRLASATRDRVGDALEEARTCTRHPDAADCVMEAIGPLLTAAAFRTDPGTVTVSRADLELILARTGNCGPLSDAEDAALSRLLDITEPG